VKISIVTVSFNSEDTIAQTISSVLSQTYKDIEYIIIDGNSSDKTTQIVKSYSNRISKFISEPDDGIYDAMNKGIEMASGDVVGILNSDDIYEYDNVISEVIETFNKDNVDSVFANLVYVDKTQITKVVRYYDSGQFKPSLFSFGLMPAHPTFFVRKSIYQKYGKFRTDMKTAADFELMTRFLYVNNITYTYLDKVLVRMRLGGASTSFGSIWFNNIGILKACNINGIRTNIFKILLRYAFKLKFLFKKRPYP
jgi:glycosyltransferase involved in cell wall biosynthesis